MVVQALDRALESVIYQDIELAGMAVADGNRIEQRCLEIQEGILTLTARQAPVAGDCAGLSRPPSQFELRGRGVGRPRLRLRRGVRRPEPGFSACSRRWNPFGLAPAIGEEQVAESTVETPASLSLR
ncbi:MAG: hypothetical protein ACLP0J_07280 [Solirubrobacteraceae bacterium]